jgi:hypothetical protein
VIAAFADAGLPLSEGVKVANAILSYRARQLREDLENYMSEGELVTTAFDKQSKDLFAIIYNSRRLLFKKADLTITYLPNYISDQSNQSLRRYYVDPQIAGSVSFSDKRRFFGHLLKHARVQVKGAAPCGTSYAEGQNELIPDELNTPLGPLIDLAHMSRKGSWVMPAEYILVACWWKDRLSAVDAMSFLGQSGMVSPLAFSSTNHEGAAPKCITLSQTRYRPNPTAGKQLRCSRILKKSCAKGCGTAFSSAPSNAT